MVLEAILVVVITSASSLQLLLLSDCVQILDTVVILERVVFTCRLLLEDLNTNRRFSDRSEIVDDGNGTRQSALFDDLNRAECRQLCFREHTVAVLHETPLTALHLLFWIES